MHAKVEGRQESCSSSSFLRTPRSICGTASIAGIKLYVRRVFIMDDAEQLMPACPAVSGDRGLNDLPLNISRGSSSSRATSRQSAPRRSSACSGLLDDLAKNEPEKYATFWKTFGRVLKEGVAEEHASRDRLAPLLRFASTHGASDERRCRSPTTWAG